MEIIPRLLTARGLPTGVRYALAFAAVLGTTIARSLLPVLGLPFLLSIPTLMVVGFALGRGPGVLGTVSTALLAAYLFVGSAFSFPMRPQDWIGVGLFSALGLAIVAACAASGTLLLRRQADLATLRDSQDALARSDAFVRGVLAASADCIKVLDLDAKLVFMNDGGQKVMEIADFAAVQGCAWPDLWKGKDREAALEALAAARAGRTGRFRGQADTFAGSPRWWDVVVTAIPGTDGRPERLLSVSRDISEAVLASSRLEDSEVRTRLLGDELQHRMKNTMATVQAMVRQTLRNSLDMASAQDTIDQRLAAMGRAHIMLTAGGWSNADLRDVVAAALDLHGREERFVVRGPRVDLPAQAATSFALLLHELGTNAVKYGALSAPGGKVAITWTLSPQPEDVALQRLEMVWRESGGPPVTAPNRRGFGSRLIERSLGSSLKGGAAIDFRNEGVVCTVTGIVEAEAERTAVASRL